MAYLDMKGPCTLTKDEIQKVIRKKTPGNFALGYVDEHNIFVVQYIGRADEDLRVELYKWVGNGYRDFKFSMTNNHKFAFLKECKNYHEFGESNKLKNSIHPKRKAGSDWLCPICDIYNKVEQEIEMEKV